LVKDTVWVTTGGGTGLQPDNTREQWRHSGFWGPILTLQSCMNTHTVA